MIRMAPRLLAFIERRARKAFPREACGLLTGQWQGDDILIRRAVASRNLAPADTRDRFEIDPALHIRLQRALRGTVETIVGLFHSHPSGSVDPSPSDMAEASYDGWIWLITAVREADCHSRAYLASTQQDPAVFEAAQIDLESPRCWRFR